MRALAVLWFILVGHAAVGGELPVGEWECSGKVFNDDGSVFSYRYTDRVSRDGSSQASGEYVLTDLESDAKATLKFRMAGKYRAVGASTLISSVDSVNVDAAQSNREDVFDINYLVGAIKELEGVTVQVNVLSLTESELITEDQETGEVEICVK